MCPLDYQSPATAAEVRLRRFARWAIDPGSPRTAAAFVLICAGLGHLIDRYHQGGPGPKDLLFLPVWAGGFWYVLCRIARSKSSESAKPLLSLFAATALFCGPLVLCDFQSGATIFRLLDVYGWRALKQTNQLSLIALLISLTMFGVISIIDFGHRWRHHQRITAPSRSE